MTKYTKDYLNKTLAGHGYDIKAMTPEWCNFAINILILERLSKK